jgi:chaperonin GroEL (HSP60 family)
MGEGRDTSTQKAQQLNIKAAIAVASTVRSTLGPLGMDKMCVDQQGHFIVSNDGASILRELDVAHPGAQMVVNMSKTQEAECKDGTTSVVVLAGKLLDNALGLPLEELTTPWDRSLLVS